MTCTDGVPVYKQLDCSGGGCGCSVLLDRIGLVSHLLPNASELSTGYPLTSLTIVVGFRTQASLVLFISDVRSTMPMEPQLNIE
jgi:hypothetical protein